MFVCGGFTLFRVKSLVRTVRVTPFLGSTTLVAQPALVEGLGSTTERSKGEGNTPPSTDHGNLVHFMGPTPIGQRHRRQSER